MRKERGEERWGKKEKNVNLASHFFLFSFHTQIPCTLPTTANEQSQRRKCLWPGMFVFFCWFFYFLLCLSFSSPALFDLTLFFLSGPLSFFFTSVELPVSKTQKTYYKRHGVSQKEESFSSALITFPRTRGPLSLTNPLTRTLTFFSLLLLTLPHPQQHNLKKERQRNKQRHR